MSAEDKTEVMFRDADGVTQVIKPVSGGFARPNPGGKRPEAPAQPAASAFGGQSSAAPFSTSTPVSSAQSSMHSGSGFGGQSMPGQMPGQWQSEFSLGTGAVENPLLAGAAALLDKMALLTLQAEQFEPMAFRDWCIQQLNQFDRVCLHYGVSEETRHYARYVLCTVLDELVNKSAWGGGVWSKQSLLSQFHGETGGGERFFQLLSFLQEYPAKNLHLLELMYVCLGLGFEGKYSLDSRGYAQLESLRDNLFHLIRMQKGEPERDLSPHWQRVTKRRNPLARYLPLWVVVAVVGVIMLATFSGFSYLLSERTSAIVAQLESLQDTEQGQ
ncbi:MAG: type IVB secretion system protein IcmH/DotU [Pseudomonadales bacterium]|nr:type IVB secretion system protein IcmH/DotU [Pseudomonadales bacterium]